MLSHLGFATNLNLDPMKETEQTLLEIADIVSALDGTISEIKCLNSIWISKVLRVDLI